MAKRPSRFFRGKRRGKGKYPHYKPRRQPVLESKGGGEHAPAPRRQRRKRSRWFKRAVKRLFWCSVVVGGAFFGWVYVTMPSIDDLNKFTKAPSILVKSQDGQIIGSFGDIYGDYVRFEDFPVSLVDAVMATEDRNFYHHFGVDPLGLARAMVANLRAGHVVQGGSTITQQVAKNVFLTPERSLMRKLREMILAIKLELRFSKQDIMSIYLNRVYLGAGNYGVDAASRRYFDKPAREMTLSESAILAGLLKAPSRFAPTSNPVLARKRADQVLVNMQDAGYLTKNQCEHARQALEQTMNGRQKSAQSALYFADWIADQIPEFVGNVQGDIVVITTLDPDLQLMGEKAIADIMDKEGEPHKASQAALVAMTPDGAVRAMLGGRSYAKSQYNRAAQAYRQPGSSFKIFVYLAGLESGYTPETIVIDEPITVPISGGTWTPKNYTGKYLGEITLREAVTESINTVAVQVAVKAGLGHVIDVARRLGITSDLMEVPSLALGSTEVTLIELTNAYAHLAAGGRIVNSYGIVEIVTTQGEVLYKRETQGGGMALAGSTVGQMNEMLLSVVQNGTGRGALIGRPAAGKTGTTSDYRDAWFMGYTPDLITGVWVGNDDNSPMKKVTGGGLPARIWHDFMIPALAGVEAHDIPTSGFSLTLPWDSDRPELPEREAAEDQPIGKKRDVELGKSFWDKLLR